MPFENECFIDTPKKVVHTIIMKDRLGLLQLKAKSWGMQMPKIDRLTLALPEMDITSEQSRAELK